MKWLRRLSQAAFLLLFLALVFTRSDPAAGPSRWLKLFFWIDPLVTVATWITAHAVPPPALAALGVLALTLLVGRVFCGWICPLGTLHALAGRLCDLGVRRKRRDSWSPWQRTKYYLLAALLVLAVFRVHWVAIWDPIALLYRSVATGALPAAQWAARSGSVAVSQADPRVGPVQIAPWTNSAYDFLRDEVFGTNVSREDLVYRGGGLILVVLVVLLALNAVRRRFWCRYLCPLGAMLGIFSWRPLLRRAADEKNCNHCGLCDVSCHGAAAAAPGEGWKPAECLACFNCTDACRRDALRFTWVRPWRNSPPAAGPDLSKRALLGAALGGLAGLGALRVSPQGRGTLFQRDLIRPPGARAEPEFLRRCTSCGLCMKICPTGALQPALWEAGLEGLWTPHVVHRIGECDYNCNACGLVCPTEAIQPLGLEEKQHTRIGLAAFDITRCIPHAYGRECMVCEEHCPIPDKAIYCVEVEIELRTGARQRIKQPHVDPAKCIGCGICERVCPYKDQPAIRVSSANESRHPENQPILPEGDEASPYG